MKDIIRKVLQNLGRVQIPQYGATGLPVPLAPFGYGAYSACGFAFGRPRPPCGPANTAGPQWLYASRALPRTTRPRFALPGA